ncbi:hypothetical protein O181_086154 [Austropuccinia psidii MF-1]|uniref:Uncharacterized protein n=1 Tax=Austropuccinia psidii MF-1 TaxID=1389203 RepID=A0A9Q3FWL5_9BASI|nr:hypothetical protein [Austropuccinia psidii MF-1]
MSGGCQSFPPFPKVCTKNVDVNSDPELIEGNILRAEPFPSCSKRNISVPIQRVVQSGKRGGVGNMPMPLAGGQELLLTHQELSGSGEDHTTPRREEPIFSQRQEGIGNDSSFGERRPSGVYQLQTCSRSVQRQSQRTSEAENFQEPSRKGQIQSQLVQTLPIGIQDPQIGALRSGQCIQYGQDSHGIYSQGAGKDEQDFSMQKIQEIRFVNINVELGKIEEKLTRIKLDINEFKNNNKHSAEWHKSTISKLELISDTCDRIDSKYQVQDDEMDNLSTTNINYQLDILKNHVLTVVGNTNQFAIHLARSDSERQKFKNEILAYVEQTHKNYEPNPHIPRNSKPLTEKKLSVKGILTPFLGESPLFPKDIPKLKEWPTISGEGEYNHIELIRAIDMLQEDVHIPD